MTEKNAQLAADADAAADVIERRGWHQGGFQDEVTGAVCAAGAVRLVVGLEGAYGGSRWHAAASRYNATLGALHQHVDAPVSYWNDSPERTADEVIGAFRDVATKHRPDEMTETHP